MPLYLHYIDSITPHLEEILAPLVAKHIDFKLKDSFRLLTPDLTAAQDIEAQLLQDPRLGQVLIGKSVLSFQNFWLDLLHSHPQQRPMAPVALEDKAFYQTCQKYGVDWDLEQPELRRQALRELKSFAWLQSWQQPQALRPSTHPYEEHTGALLKQAGFWSDTEAFAAFLELCHQQSLKELKGVQEIFCLGWPGPDPQLLRFFKALQTHHAHIKIYFFLPKPAACLDSGGQMSACLEALQAMAESTRIYKDLSPAQVIPQIYTTPWHEAAGLLDKQASLAKENSPHQASGLYLGQEEALLFYLRSQLNGQDLNPAWEASAALASLKKQLQVWASELNVSETIYFEQFFEELLAWLSHQRLAWAKQQLPQGLQALDALYQSACEISQASALFSHLATRELWLEEVLLGAAQALKRFRPPLPQNWQHWGQARLRFWEDLSFGGLHEGGVPLHQGPSLLDLPQNPLQEHWQRLKFRQLLYQSNRLHLSYAEYDMSGRARGPSPLLAEFLEAREEPAPHEDLNFSSPLHTFLLGKARHPFHQENIQREKARREHPTADNGTLNALPPEEWQRQLKRRLLSPSYIDDYAKCPWRFFARWHLKIDSREAENLYVEPKYRGQWMHQLLEKTYRHFLTSHFTQQKIPGLNDLQQRLEHVSQTLMKEIQQEESLPWIPAEVLHDEMAKAKAQVWELIQNEWERWQNQSEPLLPHELEWHFGSPSTGKPKALNIDIAPNNKVQLTGFIDRVDYNPKSNEYLVIDYKSSNTGALSSRLREHRSFQLFIYGQAVATGLYAKAYDLGGLYWDLKETKLDQGLAPKERMKEYGWKKIRSKSFVSEESFAATTQALEEALKNQIQKILKGEYSLSPTECEGTHCPYHEVCRYDKQG